MIDQEQIISRTMRLIGETRSDREQLQKQIIESQQIIEHSRELITRLDKLLTEWRYADVAAGSDRAVRRMSERAD